MFRLLKKIKRPYIFLTVFVIVIVVIFVTSHRQYFPKTSSWEDADIKYRRHLSSVGDVMYISSWMTFDYINKTFDLPGDYLKEDLQLESMRYPLITVKHYAKGAKVNPDDFLKKVQRSVWKYLNRPPVK